jgi:hypothetical protein
MEKLVSCAFNIDTACVELHFTEGSIYSINCTAVENEASDNGACCLTASQAMIKKKLPEMLNYYESKGCSVQTLDETMQF